jgi:hypothetical protein
MAALIPAPRLKRVNLTLTKGTTPKYAAEQMRSCILDKWTRIYEATAEALAEDGTDPAYQIVARRLLPAVQVARTLEDLAAASEGCFTADNGKYSRLDPHSAPNDTITEEIAMAMIFTLADVEANAFHEAPATSPTT